MQVFKDRNGQTWTIDIVFGTVQRVKTLHGIELTGLWGDSSAPLKPWAALVDDLPKFVAVVYECCVERTDRNLEELGNAWDGDTFDRAVLALREGIIDFFPASSREALRATFTKVMEIGSEAQKTSAARVNALNATDAAESVLRFLTTERTGNASRMPSGELRESSDATQPAALSANS